MTRWLAGAGQRLLQLLPINETSPDDPSPYGALSAMAIDPQYISLADMEDFAAIGGERSLDGQSSRQRSIACARLAAIDYRAVRELKQHVAPTRVRSLRGDRLDERLGAARRPCARLRRSTRGGSMTTRSFARCTPATSERPWTEWPEPLRDRRAAARSRPSARALRDEMLFRSYLQWIAGEQWADARSRSNGVALFGDLPFMVSGDSADVWARQDEFGQDGSVGVPPDAFSDVRARTGACRPIAGTWSGQRDFELAPSARRRMAQLFDGYRVDHVVGFYRTFVRPRGGGAGVFTPADEPSQTRAR